jgi:hypothetical protein
MADSKPEVEMGFNEERRMLEMARDDDDLQDDVAAFGFSDNAAINVEDDEEEPPPPPADCPRTAAHLTKAKVRSLPLLFGRTLTSLPEWRMVGR